MLKRQGYVKRKARKVKAMGPRQVPSEMELQSRPGAHLNRQVIRGPVFGALPCNGAGLEYRFALE